MLTGLIFGVGHLPVAMTLLGDLSASVVAWVVTVNAFFGILFGALYWARGLEAAIIAHALTHVVHFIAGIW